MIRFQIIREYVDGVDLATLLKNPSLCPALKSPERRLQLAIGITSGMCNLHHHRLPIVHGDFKASDVLVDAATLTPKAGSIGLEYLSAMIYFDHKRLFKLISGSNFVGILGHSELSIETRKPLIEPLLFHCRLPTSACGTSRTSSSGTRCPRATS